MSPNKERFDYDEVLFSEWIESIRKDVECTFGILKARFRILHCAIQYHSASVIENIMIIILLLYVT